MEEDKAASGFDQHRRAGLALSALLGLAWAHCACAAPKHFDLPAGAADKMLIQFSQQAEMQLLFDFPKLAGRKTNAVVGDYEPLDALKKLIDGLPVRYTLVNPTTLALTMVPAKDEARPRRWWQRPPAKPAAPPSADLEQVLVAGSYSLNQAPPVGASLIRLDRVDIEQSGLATAQDFLHTLPQVFGGGPSEDTQIGREAVTNSTKGAGVNLRGLDAGATLVLINGQRTAPSGTSGLFADISGIPLSAVDHIDVLPDGASAQYGADAIGGVVNFVLRSNFTGAQTEVRDGDFNGNPLGGRMISQLFGWRFDSTMAMVGFEYYDRNALPASDRLQATSNLTSFGGNNFDGQYGIPGTIVAGQKTYAIPSGGIPPSSTPQLVAGTQNLYDSWEGADVLLDEQRWSAFGTLRSELTDGLELYVDSLFTRRKMLGVTTAGEPLQMKIAPVNPYYFNPAGGNAPVTVIAGSQGYFGSPYSDDSVDTGNMGLGLTWKVTDSWSLNAHVGYTFENEDTAAHGLYDATALANALADPEASTALDPFEGSAGNNPTTLANIERTGLFASRSSLKMVAINFGGALFDAPGGNAILSTGVEYRDENFDTTSATAAAAPYPVSGQLPLRTDLSRTLHAELAELRVPLIGPENSRPFLRSFEVSVGERVEDYSDVGRAGVPKAGFSWSPSADLAVRGTWTRSFRPPALSDLAASAGRSDLATLPDSSSASGLTNVLFASGSNPNLADERARTWTLGMQLTPTALRGLSVALTYFDTYYSNRIDSLLLGANVLNQPGFAWVVNRDFTPAQRAAICAQTLFAGNAGDCLDAPIGAIIDNRLRNIQYLQTRGLDLLAKYSLSSSYGRFDLGFNGTYLIDYAEQQTPDSPVEQLLNTQNNPINLRFRSSLSWQRAGLGASVFVNFSNSYRDLLSDPSRSVRSFTTLDLQLRYSFVGIRSGPLANTELSLTAENLFNSSPPFLNNSLGVGYDEENADLVGRILSVDIRKRW